MILSSFDQPTSVYGGCDLSTTTDLTSFAMVQRRDDMGWNINWLYWIPEETAQKAERKDGVPYRRWEEEGYLSFTPGGRINHRHVKADIVEACVEHGIGHVGYDPWNAEWLQAELEHEGIEPIQVRQGYASLSESCKHLEASVAEGSFKHGGNPISAWMAENVEVQTDVNGNIRPVKPQHGSNKRIDGIAAAVIAIAVSINICDTMSDGSEFAKDGTLWY